MFMALSFPTPHFFMTTSKQSRNNTIIHVGNWPLHIFRDDKGKGFPSNTQDVLLSE